MLKRDEAYDHLKSLPQTHLLRLMSHVVTFPRSPKSIHGSVMTYSYDSCETFTTKCKSFDPEKFEQNVGDVRWIKVILDLISNNPVDFIVNNAEYICVTLHGIEIVQFRNTSSSEKTHYVIIEYDRLQQRILKDRASPFSFTDGFLGLSSVALLGMAACSLVYAYLTSK